MSEYCLKNGYKRLKQLRIEVNYDWYNDRLIYMENFPNLKFWKTLPSQYLEYIKIPLNQVVGTDHIDYADNKWLENLGCLKRFPNYYTNESCRQYFDSDEKKTGVSFLKFDNEYIITSGNHRTHIARFLDYQFIEGNVQEYFFDYQFYNLVNGYEKENLPLTSQSSILHREGIWETQISGITFLLHGYDILKQFLNLYRFSKASWIKSKKNALTNFLSSNSTRSFVNVYEQKDFQNSIFENFSGLKYDKLKKAQTFTGHN